MKWKPGDFALIKATNSRFRDRLDGKICQLISYIGYAHGRDNIHTENAWNVEVDGYQWNANECVLHPIPEGKGSWDNIEHIWKPKVLEIVGENNKL